MNHHNTDDFENEEPSIIPEGIEDNTFPEPSDDDTFDDYYINEENW